MVSQADPPGARSVTSPVVAVMTHREDGSRSQAPAPPHWNPRGHEPHVDPHPSDPQVRPAQLGVQTHTPVIHANPAGHAPPSGPQERPEQLGPGSGPHTRDEPHSDRHSFVGVVDPQF